jgi:hypothetical protein
MNHKLLMLAQAFAAAAVLTACGGGGSDAPVVPPVAGPLDQVPDSASQSATGMTDYLGQLSAAPAASADAREPLDLSNYKPKTSDDTEPQPVS